MAWNQGLIVESVPELEVNQVQSIVIAGSGVPRSCDAVC
jgi:hypothetical protein